MLNGVITPLLLTYILILANRSTVLGTAKNGPIFKSVATVCVAAVGLLSFVVLVQTVFGLGSGLGRTDAGVEFASYTFDEAMFTMNTLVAQRAVDTEYVMLFENGWAHCGSLRNFLYLFGIAVSLRSGQFLNSGQEARARRYPTTSRTLTSSSPCNDSSRATSRCLRQCASAAAPSPDRSNRIRRP